MNALLLGGWVLGIHIINLVFLIYSSSFFVFSTFGPFCLLLLYPLYSIQMSTLQAEVLDSGSLLQRDLPLSPLSQ